MFDIDQFLSESVFYPCSGLDGAPVKFLGKRFQKFFYADIGISNDKFSRACTSPGFLGYALKSLEEIDFSLVFGTTHTEIQKNSEKLIDKPRGTPIGTHMTKAFFLRLPGFDDTHGPSEFELLFACCESVTTFLSVYSSRSITPRCLAHIRPGLAFGGNYSQYPLLLEEAVRTSRGGLPDFLLYDHGCNNSGGPNHFGLIPDYQPLKRWDYQTENYGMGNVTLAKKIAVP